MRGGSHSHIPRQKAVHNLDPDDGVAPRPPHTFLPFLHFLLGSVMPPKLRRVIGRMEGHVEQPFQSHEPSVKETGDGASHSVLVSFHPFKSSSAEHDEELSPAFIGWLNSFHSKYTIVSATSTGCDVRLKTRLILGLVELL